MQDQSNVLEKWCFEDVFNRLRVLNDLSADAVDTGIVNLEDGIEIRMELV